MAISEDKERLTFVLDKSLKHKLQVLSDADKIKLSSYVYQIVENHLISFEKSIFEKYGKDAFNEMHNKIFGEEYPPHFVPSENQDEEKREIIQELKQIAKRASGRKVDK